MDDLPRQKLKEILDQHGLDLCTDPRRTRALLLDLCGAHRLEVNLLISAQEEKVPGSLMSLSGKAPGEGLFNRLAKGLQEYRGMTPDAAHWAVESWALALGVAVPAAWRRKKGRSTSAPPPPPQAPLIEPEWDERDQFQPRPFFGNQSASLPFRAPSPQPVGTSGSAPSLPPQRQKPTPAAPQPVPAFQRGARPAARAQGNPAPSRSSSPVAPQSAAGPARTSPSSYNPSPSGASQAYNPPPAGSGELVVSARGNSPFRTITEALLKARPGMRVRVMPGIYRENVQLFSAVELVGDGPADQVVIEGEPALIISSGHVLVRGLTLRSTSAFLPAVKLSEGPALIRDCLFGAAFENGAVHPAVERRCRGLAARGSNVEAVLQNCQVLPLIDPQRSEPAAVIGLEIELAGRSRLAVEGGSFGEVRVTGESRTLIKGSQILVLATSGSGGEARIQDCQIGQVIITGGAGPLLSGCKVQTTSSPLAPQVGVIVQGKSAPRLQACQISGQSQGVLVSDGAFLELEDCQVSVNGSSAGKSRLPAALRLQEWARGSLENCSFSGAGHGIDLDTESWVEARRCRISANAGWGIWAHHQGGGLVEASDLTGNGAGSIQIETGCQVRQIGNRS